MSKQKFAVSYELICHLKWRNVFNDQKNHWFILKHLWNMAKFYVFRKHMEEMRIGIEVFFVMQYLLRLVVHTCKMFKHLILSCVTLHVVPEKHTRITSLIIAIQIFWRKNVKSVHPSWSLINLYICRHDVLGEFRRVLCRLALIGQVSDSFKRMLCI